MLSCLLRFDVRRASVGTEAAFWVGAAWIRPLPGALVPDSPMIGRESANAPIRVAREKRAESDS